jgi:hypothetical protein
MDVLPWALYLLPPHLCVVATQRIGDEVMRCAKKILPIILIICFFAWFWELWSDAPMAVTEWQSVAADG